MIVPRRVSTLAAISFALVAGCASVRSDMARSAARREAVAQHRIAKPLDAVWPEALRLLADRGYPLIGQDRVKVGLAADDPWTKLFNYGHETQRASSTRIVAETNYDPQRVRYRVEGIDTGGGTCRIEYTAIQGNMERPDEDAASDSEMALDLIRRVEPEAAEKIEAKMDAAARR